MNQKIEDILYLIRTKLSHKKDPLMMDEEPLEMTIPDRVEPRTKLEVAPKKNAVKPQQFLVLAVLLGLASGIGYVMFHSPTAPAPTSTHKEEAKDDSTSLSAIDVQALAVNPFVEVASGNVVPTGENAVKPVAGNPTLPAIAAPRPSVPSYSVPASSSLPAIPAINPRPSSLPVPGELNVKVPPAPDSSGGDSSTSSGNSVSVQGVMTGEDGTNIAILSDGTVVGEGETYHDGRIAYIGGDGIRFDNGDKLEYK